MASPKQLSEIHTEMDLASGSKEADAKLSAIQERVGRDLEDKYGVKIIFESRFSNVELYADHLPADMPKHALVSKKPEQTGIMPDGGILLVETTGQDGNLRRMPILVSENKKQGTGKTYFNKYGRPYKAKGNAVERLAKNIQYLRNWLSGEAILPFVAFCYGSDFCPNSYIIDRVASMANFAPGNTINENAVSWFYRETPFGEKEIYDILYVVAKNSLDYYMGKVWKLREAA